jgi:hypothetical protein
MRPRLKVCTPACLLALVAAAVAAAGDSAAAAPAAAAAPRVVAVSRLSALPAALSQGGAGPLNRVAIDVDHLGPSQGSVRVTCVYGGKLVYGCEWRFADQGRGTRRRIEVDVPDLDRDRDVAIQISTPAGTVETGIEIDNRPALLHEIETLALPRGGISVVDGSGRQVPSRELAYEQLQTSPAIATGPEGRPPACDKPYAQWRGASVTDAVFSASAGTLNGAVAPARTPAAGSQVAPDNVPTWLVTYPRGAIRVQFIAHYEVIWRIGLCEARLRR